MNWPGQGELTAVSARAALRARLAGASHDQIEGGDFAAFAEALSRFVERDLVQARLGTGRAELARLAHQLEGSLAIEAASTSPPGTTRSWSTWRAPLPWANSRTRVDAVRTAAADIFEVELPGVPVPEMADERERYFHLLLHVETSTEGVDRLVRRLLPPATVRRRLLEQARRELAEEFDKHAGRAHWDLANAWARCASGSRPLWRLNWTARWGPSWPRPPGPRSCENKPRSTGASTANATTPLAACWRRSQRVVRPDGARGD